MIVMQIRLKIQVCQRGCDPLVACSQPGLASACQPMHTIVEVIQLVYMEQDPVKVNGVNGLSRRLSLDQKLLNCAVAHSPWGAVFLKPLPRPVWQRPSKIPAEVGQVPAKASDIESVTLYYLQEFCFLLPGLVFFRQGIIHSVKGHSFKALISQALVAWQRRETQFNNRAVTGGNQVITAVSLCSITQVSGLKPFQCKPNKYKNILKNEKESVGKKTGEG